jgi:hypothetical protein
MVQRNGFDRISKKNKTHLCGNRKNETSASRKSNTNIQSIVSKIDMISAEYSCHDILSFTESWLSENTSTDQQNENVLFMSSLTADILSKSLLELLEMSESNGPGLISINVWKFPIINSPHFDEIDLIK